MKKLFVLAAFGFLLTGFLSSCFHHGNDVLITISDDEYEMEASYQKRKTHAVKVYLNDQLLNNSVTFRNDSDEEIVLDDNTTISLRSYPGRLNIKLVKQRTPKSRAK